MKCPDCENGFTIASHVRYADGTGAFGVQMECDRCQGTGFAPDEMAAWIAKGREMRDRRVNIDRRTLREEAKRRGVDVVTLSKMERGVIEPREENQ